MSTSGGWSLSATVRPRELPDRRWEFAFSEVVLVGGQRRTIHGQLVLGGRTPAGAFVQPAGRFGWGVVGFLGGIAGQLPVVKEVGKELLGADGPAAAVRESGGVAEVQLSEPNDDQVASGTVNLHGIGHLTVRGLPRAATVLLNLERLR